MLETATAIAVGAFAVVFGVMRPIKLYIDVYNGWPQARRISARRSYA